jgi:hypothetical protein
MKIFADRQTRQQYLDTQVARSRNKFRDCKVSMHDAAAAKGTRK